MNLQFATGQFPGYPLLDRFSEGIRPHFAVHFVVNGVALRLKAFEFPRPRLAGKLIVEGFDFRQFRVVSFIFVGVQVAPLVRAGEFEQFVELPFPGFLHFA